MKRVATLKHEFVEFIPEKLEEGTIYVSVVYATASHRCCCGCGLEVVTPLSPTDWKLLFDGVSVSLDPSIGNWSFPCRSHYWVKRNTVQWAGQWSREEVVAGRLQDSSAKERYFAPTPASPPSPANSAAGTASNPKKGAWVRFKRWVIGN